jgi:hypothetical protein
MTKTKLGKKGLTQFTLLHCSLSLKSQDRNSDRAGPWRQEPMQRRGWGLLTGLLSQACSTCSLFLFVWFGFQDRVSLCSPGCSGTHSVDQAGLELRNPPASASRVLGLKAWATTPGFVPSSKDWSIHILVFLLLELHLVCELYLGYSELLG